LLYGQHQQVPDAILNMHHCEFRTNPKHTELRAHRNPKAQLQQLPMDHPAHGQVQCHLHKVDGLEVVKYLLKMFLHGN
jgi:hypothetical protein